MIRLLETLPNGNGYLYGLVRGLYEAYGPSLSFLRFYGDENGNLLAIMDDVATVLWKEDQAEELTLFLETQTVSCVRTDPQTAAHLTRKQRWKTTMHPIMKAMNVLPSLGETVSLSPRELYPLLKESFPDIPPFEGWYLDVSHRMRHGFCHVCAVRENDLPVSSAMTTSEWDKGAAIGAVATASDYRRNGYGSRCVSALTAQLKEQGKEVYVCPLSGAAQRLYEKLGFVVCGETAILERN